MRLNMTIMGGCCRARCWSRQWARRSQAGRHRAERDPFNPRPAGKRHCLASVAAKLSPIPGSCHLRRPVMGMSPPAAPATSDSVSNFSDAEERSGYAVEMTGEEMERQIADIMETSTGIGSPLEASVEEGHGVGTSSPSL